MLRELNFEGIPVTYELCSTGRYFATHATLQGYSKEVRYAALHTCYAYDLESAHQSILVQLLDKKGIENAFNIGYEHGSRALEKLLTKT